MDMSSGVEESYNDREKLVASEENDDEKGGEGKRPTPAFCEPNISPLCA